MFKLISIEFRKLLPYRSFWIILSAYTVIVSLVFYGVSSESLILGQLTKTMMYYPDIWHNASYVASWMNLLLVFIVVMYSANEFTYKTYRQNVIDGLSKLDLILSKMLYIGAITLFSTLLLFIVVLFIGNYPEEGGFSSNLFTEQIHFLGFHFVKTYSYLSLAFLFSILFRRSIITVILLLLYIIIENIGVSIILTQNSSDSITNIIAHVVNFMPLHTYSNLIPLPSTLFGQSFPSEFDMSTSTLCALTVIYGFVFNGLTYLVLQKRSI